MILGVIWLGYVLATRPNLDAVSEEGNALIEELIEYRRTHGRFPDSLDQLDSQDGDADPMWRYERWGGTFDIKYGDYGEDGYEIRHQGRGRWYLDS